MAEIRKYDPAAGNAIAQALRAAMGEPVRPNVPGERSAPPATQPTQTASVVNFAVTTNVVSPADDEDADQD